MHWREALSKLGFAQLVGHGVPDDVIEAAYSAARGFFDLSDQEKRKCDLGLGYGPGGFTAQGVERVSATASKPDGSALLGAAKARPPDRVENMLVHRRPTDVIPEGVTGYQKAVHNYYDEMLKVLRAIMRLTACALDLPLDYFEPHYFEKSDEGCLRNIGTCTLRMAFYPKFDEKTELVPGQLRYGEHTDYQGFTILWQDHNANGPQTAKEGCCPPAGGLQVQLPSGHWTDCPPLPGALTINAGDLIQVWTNDVFFTGPKKDTIVECLPTCCGPDRPQRYAPIGAEEHLQRKLQASNL
jgi:isopenicillin N synthase-like dioxygenase